MSDLRQSKRPTEWPKSGLYWHLHHDRLIEYTHDIDERWDYVCSEKSVQELPTRLRLMRPVRGDVPGLAAADAAAARAEWNAASAEWDAAYAEWAKARAEWDTACADHMPEILALHVVECPDCPWDGKTIFPEGGPR
jgi:hypothetical protein